MAFEVKAKVHTRSRYCSPCMAKSHESSIVKRPAFKLIGARACNDRRHGELVDDQQYPRPRMQKQHIRRELQR